MIQRMLAIWSLVPLPFLKPAWTSGSSRFTYCWSLAWRILSITLLACEFNSYLNDWQTLPVKPPGPGLYFDYCFSLFVCACLLSPFSLVHLFATLWTGAHQASLSMRFSRQEHWSGLPCPPPGNLPHSGIKPRSPALQVDSLPAEPPGKPFSLLTSNLFVHKSFWSVLIDCF